MRKKKKRKDTVLQDGQYCYLCKVFYGLYRYGEDLEPHHCLNGIGKRSTCDELGLWVWLCPEHHRTGVDAVHRDIELRQKLKQIAQAYFERNIGSRQDFIDKFGKNYL